MSGLAGKWGRLTSQAPLAPSVASPMVICDPSEFSPYQIDNMHGINSQVIVINPCLYTKFQAHW